MLRAKCIQFLSMPHIIRYLVIPVLIQVGAPLRIHLSSTVSYIALCASKYLMSGGGGEGTSLTSSSVKWGVFWEDRQSIVSSVIVLRLT